ncbi:phosphonoacetate hydrolase [Nocardioides aromaticivorans]|uniref:Phosphonoacetate hydrolase n=1 Tax=Nocardioides aromaticivorans TaxID=200618 RepID=A0ABX7PJC6_9ACTN|nr:zinc ribbon domain-containing protein YjdM [Nocardioides aromaticivorans]QSR26006.1 phosphonoacetate hydrolase [Nocardioides aromaticivorans]
MTDTLPACPECSSEYTYEMGELMVCPECAHEWSPAEAAAAADAEAAAGVVRDANGNPLADGDDVIVVKDLPVKGAPKPIKSGTKVRSIRLVSGVGDHDIDCKVDGFGPMQLKSSVVRKA